MPLRWAELLPFFNIGIRIYPGTELEHRAREEGVLTAPPGEMLEPVFYLSPALVDSASRYDPKSRDHIRYIYKTVNSTTGFPYPCRKLQVKQSQR